MYKTVPRNLDFVYSSVGNKSSPNVVYRIVKVGPPVHNYEHEAGSYGDGFT